MSSAEMWRIKVSDSRIEILEGGIRILNVEVNRREVADFVSSLPEEDRESTVVRAVELGVLALERARIGLDTEFVRRQVESLLREVQTAVSKIPAETQKSLADKIGSEEGQVLASVQVLVTNVKKAADEKMEEIRKLLTNEIDPSKQDSTLAKALRALQALLDPDRTDSVQGALNSAIRNASTSDGAIAQTVKTIVVDAMKPLASRVENLTLEFRGEKSREDALSQTTLKGLTYEDEILGRLDTWKLVAGAQVEHVGKDNRPGDITVSLPDATGGSSRLVIVIEVRDTQDSKGRKGVSGDLAKSMVERGACAAVYLSRGRDGLAKEIGEWAEGSCERGSWVACTDEHLITAIRFLAVQWAMSRKRTGTVDLDAAGASNQIERIRIAIKRIATINSKASLVSQTAEGIKSEAQGLRDDIGGALTELEGCLHLSRKVATPVIEESHSQVDGNDANAA
jgi:hypothetical protein